MAQNIIVLFKNPVAGKVKTRLAATIGDEKALMIYMELLAHTFTVARSVQNTTIHLFFSDFIDTNLKNMGSEDLLYLQTSGSLGDKIKHAFETVHQPGDKTLILGSDCPGIHTKIIDQAFRLLDSYQVVIGPATDGGYYLMGLTDYNSTLFESIQWSSDQVLKQSYQRAIQAGMQVRLIRTLSDIDVENDLHLIDGYY